MKRIQFIILMLLCIVNMNASELSYKGYNNLDSTKTYDYVYDIYFGEIMFTDVNYENKEVTYKCMDCMKVRKDSELGHYIIYFIYDVILNYNIGYIEIKNIEYDYLIYDSDNTDVEYMSIYELVKHDNINLRKELDRKFNDIVKRYEKYK